ncbi:MAG: hypothetical protein AB2A00_15300 [Myxococcota bacterium]
MTPFILTVAMTVMAADAPATPPVPVETRPSVAVLELQAKQGVSADTATLLTANLVTLLRAQGRFSKVVSSSEIETLLGFEQQKQLLACDSSSCMAELAGALGVDYVVSGTLGRLGDQWLLNLTLLNTRTTQAEGSVSMPVAGNNEAALLKAMETVPAQLLQGSRVPGGVAAPQPAPTTSAAPAEEGGGGMLGNVLKGVGALGLGGAALAAVVGGAGALLSSGIWVTLFLRPELTRGRNLGPLITAGYLGGWSVAGVMLAVMLLSTAAGVGMLVAGVVLG